MQNSAKHSTKNMLLTAEMPFKRVCRNGRRAQGERVLLSERAGGITFKGSNPFTLILQEYPSGYGAGLISLLRYVRLIPLAFFHKAKVFVSANELCEKTFPER